MKGIFPLHEVGAFFIKGNFSSGCEQGEVFEALRAVSSPHEKLKKLRSSRFESFVLQRHH